MLDRRRFLKNSLALGAAFPLSAFPPPEPGEQVIPFLDTKPFSPEKPLMPWDQLSSWVTPTEHLFAVAHYGYPEVKAESWRLEIRGLVERPQVFTLDDLRARPRREVVTMLECSGNGPAGGLAGNCRWTGTPLAPLLRKGGLKKEAIEAVFFAADSGAEKIRGGEYLQNFARSLAVEDALQDNVLVAYELNGRPLDSKHGAPARLIVPGWYGVAWVKWLTRVELHDRHYLSRFMGRDYVTIRGEKQGDQTIWRETSVGRMNLKSVPARVVRRPDGQLRVTGAAWSDGAAVKRVEVKIDDGEWRAATLGEGSNRPFTWTFWSYDWPSATPGEHVVSSRATDARGRVQPAPDNPFITLKKTYWEANQQARRSIRIEG